MNATTRPSRICLLGFAVLPACVRPAPAPELDGPLPGLTEDELARFEAGEEIFDSAFLPELGLGPLFNARSCVECHAEPTDGGGGPIRELHVSAIGPEGVCDPLLALGGPVIQERATPALEALGISSEPIPAEAVLATRSTPDVFGLGLLDAIPDATILALADPDDRDGDGISGRVHLLRGGHVGRFGRKAVVASLATFNEGAFPIELGITTPNHPAENTLGGDPLPEGVDPVPDPELPAEFVALVDDYVRFLAPPAPAPLDALARKGMDVFRRIRCAACHVPSLRTGPHEVEALSEKEVFAYTDLLLHDMGPDLADICFLDASPSEFRTEPLMGLRHVRRFLHDGRAATVSEAILAHGGEARGSRDAFVALCARDREALLAFLARL